MSLKSITRSSLQTGNVKSNSFIANAIADWSTATSWFSNGDASYSAPAPGVLIWHAGGGTITLDGVLLSNTGQGCSVTLPYTTSCVITNAYAHGVQFANAKQFPLGGRKLNTLTQTRTVQATGPGSPNIDSTYTYTLPTGCFLESVTWTGSFQNNGQGPQNVSHTCYISINGVDTGNTARFIGTWGWSDSNADGGKSYTWIQPIGVPGRGTLSVRVVGSGGTGNTPHYATHLVVYSV